MIDALVDPVAEGLDRAVLWAQHGKIAESEELKSLSPQARVIRLRELGERYGDPALLAWPGGFLTPGPVIEPVEVSVRRGVTDLAWPSAYTPWNAEIAADYLAHVGNQTAHARVFWGGPRVLLLIHGYGAGHFGLEEHLWPTRAAVARGFTVVLATLPFHGRRAHPRQVLTPPFPAADPRHSNEGFRQAIDDLTGLFTWLRRRGHGPFGAWGVSLGAYTAALLATLEPLAFLGLMTPLASLADYARMHGRLGEGAVADAGHAALERVNAPISPFSRPSRVPPDRVRIAAARSDQITGMAQAERLGRHFGAEVERCVGGHILRVGVRPAVSRWVPWIDALP